MTEHVGHKLLFVMHSQIHVSAQAQVGAKAGLLFKFSLCGFLEPLSHMNFAVGEAHQIPHGHSAAPVEQIFVFGVFNHDERDYLRLDALFKTFE